MQIHPCPECRALTQKWGSQTVLPLLSPRLFSQGTNTPAITDAPIIISLPYCGWNEPSVKERRKKRSGKKCPPPFHFQRFIIFLLLSGNEQMVINVTRESFLSACQVFHTDTLCSVFHRKWISSCGRLLFFPPPFLFFNPLLASFQFDLASKSVPL